MAQISVPSTAQTASVTSEFLVTVAEVGQVIEKAAQALSDTTHHISMVLRPQLKKSGIKQTKLS